MTTTRLWELSNEIQQLENALGAYADDESLTEEERETKLQETFAQWLKTGESFKVKAEQTADTGVATANGQKTTLDV